MPRWPGYVDMENPTRARSWKRRIQPRGWICVDMLPLRVTGGQGVRRKVESEGHAEQYRAVAKAAMPWRTGRPKVGPGRACTMEAKAFSFTHRTKVFADGTVRKIWT
jgi:hypothetical protein